MRMEDKDGEWKSGEEKNNNSTHTCTKRNRNWEIFCCKLRFKYVFMTLKLIKVIIIKSINNNNNNGELNKT